MGKNKITTNIKGNKRKRETLKTFLTLFENSVVFISQHNQPLRMSLPQGKAVNSFSFQANYYQSIIEKVLT